MVKIVLSGVQTNNKGAELMLYAILQQIEKQHPDADVFIARGKINQGLDYVKSPVKLEYIPETRSWFVKFCQCLKITAILNRIGCYSSFLNNSCPIKDADYFIDGSGLLFSDKLIKSKQTALSWHARLRGYHYSGAKVIFLPQGFGPFNIESSKLTISSLDDFADLIFAREKVSYNYLLSVVKNRYKVKLYTDFTSLVEGIIPNKFAHLSGKVCIIPNIQMIKKGVLKKDEYFYVLDDIIDTCLGLGYNAYFLNHEGIDDESLAKEYILSRNSNIELVSGLNALEVKGLISTAYLVISSRFHGVASSLNCHVPCLATSWHHKYAELFKDFGMIDCVLPLDNHDERQKRIEQFLDEKNNSEIRGLLTSKKPAIMEQNKQMWNLIWSLK